MKNFNNLLKSGLLLVLAAVLFASCDDENNCVRGSGDVETRVLSLDAFNGVKANGTTRVFVKRGATQRVEVKGQPNVLDAINTAVNNGVWDISFDSCLRSHKAVEVYMTVPELNLAEVSGSGRVELQDQFEPADFKASLDGSGSVKADVLADKVTSRITGSGTIDLLGMAEVHEINIAGSGNVKAFSLSTQNTGVQISGSGNAEVHAAANLTVSISGSGNVYYQGSPAVDSNITGSGKVMKR